MVFFSGLKADRLISEITTATDPNSDGVHQAVEKLRKVGPSAVPRIIDAFAASDKKVTPRLVEALSDLATDKSLKYFVEGLADGNSRVVQGTAWALSSTKGVSPRALLKLLENEEVSKSAVITVLESHKDDISVREMLTCAYELEDRDKTALFKIINSVVSDDYIPELIARVDGKDATIKMNLLSILSRFPRPDVISKVEKQIDDPNRNVRQHALKALAKLGGSSNAEKIASLLLDGDLDVQNLAADLLIQIKDPQTVKYLIPALRDENEYSRRAAVEVLNEVGNPDAVKDLLQAIQDEDWWVRSRAADALASIGGPKVVDAALQLISDDDEEIRRVAMEILNETKDPRAVDKLLSATKDGDWWVRERAVDALASIGNTKVVPNLAQLLGKDDKTDPAILRALTKLGNAKVLGKVLPMLNKNDRAIRVETMKALAHLVDERHAEKICGYLEKMKSLDDTQIVNAADNAIKEIESRFSSAVKDQDEKAEKFTNKGDGTARTLLVDNSPVEELIAEVGAADILDISTLAKGDIIDGRYEFIERIGKGAFGTVLLMQDKVVDEQLILKFLNANVSSDEEMMKRFVHELRFSRRITHPNVIRIYDFLSVQGLYAISMEYFPSHTLGAEIQEHSPMTYDMALKYAIDIATGMTVAHEAGVIHRDLKPANLLINDEQILKIVDFGVAAAASSGDTQLTKTGYVIGSPKYMAPEQILGKRVDEKADIYSLGVILYEMLTGTPPYTRGDHMSVMYQHVQGKAKLCQEIRADIPDDLAEIVGKTMSVDKNARYENMLELREALEGCSVGPASKD
ncbi:MAG: HEAT repeat domain-containing protein [Pseudomonadota bacterium]